MLNLNGFRAWITVDHKPLDAFNVDINVALNTATCWVPSTAGKAFTVTWQDLNRVRTHATSGRVTVDGIACGGKVIPPTGQSRTNQARRSGVRTGPDAVRPFTFGKLELTDDDKYLDTKTPQNLGEITLTIHRVHIEGSSTAHGRRVPTEAESVVHERSKKAMSHRVKLGEEIKSKRRKSTIVRDVDREPVATFTFKYRPLDLLMAKNIAPLTPPQTPKQTPKRTRRNLKRSHDEVTSDEEVEVIVLEKPLARASSRASSRARTPKEKKRKLPVKPKAEKSSVPGEIIDLT